MPVSTGRLRPHLHHRLQPPEPHPLLPRAAAPLRVRACWLRQDLCHEGEPCHLGVCIFSARLPGDRGVGRVWKAGVWRITLAPAGVVLHQAGQTPDGPLPPEVQPSAWLEPAGSARPGPAPDPLTQKSGGWIHSFVF